MPPNLRCVAAQGWRWIGCRRNLSSSSLGSNGEKHVTTVLASKRVVSYLNSVEIPTYILTGIAIEVLIELYQTIKIGQRTVEQRDAFNRLMKRLLEVTRFM